MKTAMFGALGRWAAVATAAMIIAGCGLQKQTEPSLIGPADLGLSIRLTASPDQLPRDGSSRSVVTVLARDPQNRPIVGQRLILSLGTNSAAGAALSQTEVTTNADGTATFTVSAPSSGSTGNAIIVIATPVGTNADNTLPRTMSISVNPANGTAPTAAFTFNPTTPEIGQLVTFDASTTTDEGAACGSCNFLWNFGDGSLASGRITTHTFTAGGPYTVTLIATDTAGTSSTPATQTVNVSATSIPTAAISSISPNPPTVGQPAIFTATATSSANHRITTYTWSWGDGSSDTTTASATAAHTFSDAGRFFVTLTVRDDLGQTMQAFQNVTVSSGLVASFTATQVPPNTNHQVSFDASASVSNTGTKIVTYTWDFGDGHVSDSGSPTVTHTYSAAGTYTVKLTVTDDRGRTASTTQATGGGGGGGIPVASVR